MRQLNEKLWPLCSQSTLNNDRRKKKVHCQHVTERNFDTQLSFVSVMLGFRPGLSATDAVSGLQNTTNKQNHSLKFRTTKQDGISNGLVGPSRQVSPGPGADMRVQGLKWPALQRSSWAQSCLAPWKSLL
jgi:hypothetical protein